MLSGLPVFLLAVALAAVTEGSISQLRSFPPQGEINYECPWQHTLSVVQSDYVSSSKDRKWSFRCTNSVTEGSAWKCMWNSMTEIASESDFVNEFGRHFGFTCPRNQAIAGVRSEFQGKPTFDRRWAFLCCYFGGKQTSSCRLTPALSAIQKPINFQAKPNQVVAGWFSVRDWRKTDRYHPLPPAHGLRLEVGGVTAITGSWSAT